MQLQARYNAIDVTKLFMAFLVIGIHVRAIFEVDYPDILDFTVGTAVPFFFVCSGFFLQNKIIRSADEYHALRSAFVKYLKLYVIWHIIYLPVDLYYSWTNDRSFLGDITYLLRTFLFVGETNFSWPLWYIHGLLVAVLFIYLLRKAKAPLPAVWLISLAMMLIGYFINYVMTHDTDTVVRPFCMETADLLGSADRNGPFRGFALVATGMVIRQYYQKIGHELATGVLCIVISYMLTVHNLPFPLLFAGSGLFIMVASIHVKDRPLYTAYRTHSTFIYFIHMYILIPAHTLLQSHVSHLWHAYVVWTLTFFVCRCLACIYDRIRRNERYKWLNHLT